MEEVERSRCGGDFGKRRKAEDFSLTFFFEYRYYIIFGLPVRQHSKKGWVHRLSAKDIIILSVVRCDHDDFHCRKESNANYISQMPLASSSLPLLC
jgi:hypothetical protein